MIDINKKIFRKLKCVAQKICVCVCVCVNQVTTRPFSYSIPTKNKLLIR